METGRGYEVAIIGLGQGPTASFAADVARLGYRARLIAWPADGIPTSGPTPIATVVDFRSLGVDAERACRMAAQHRLLRRGVIIALVFEPEAARVDLALGFTDLILAPYRLSDLAARLRLARWRAESRSRPDVIRLGPLILNPATYEVFLDHNPLELTLKEYQLLLFLMQNPGRVFTREQLLDHVWGADYYGGTRTVDVHIRRLRAKTEVLGDLFETIRGVGYRLIAPPVDSA